MTRLCNRVRSNVRVTLLALALGTVAATATPVGAQSGARNGEWPTYGGDLGNTRYAPLDQITRSNFTDLEVAWRFTTDNLGPRPEFNFQSTPLMVNGRLFSTAGSRRAVVALDAGTGELLWLHSENEGKRGDAAPRQLSGRGLAYWSDGKEERVLYVTPGYRLIALDAKTGILVQKFGVNGVVDLKQDDDPEMDPIVTCGVLAQGAPNPTYMVPATREPHHNVKLDNQYVRLLDVTVPAWETRGAVIYSIHCVGCHLETLEGMDPRLR
ncbi:MAG: PQQ-binding-like beta-propeller repeat protein [Acidobacteriota bacterium]